jgi:hypothetical protein
MTRPGMGAATSPVTDECHQMPVLVSQRRDYASFADFADPDGNTWVIQEIGYRPPQGASGSLPD